MKISHVIKEKGSKVISIAPVATISDAAELLAKHNIGAVLVKDGNSLAGILSERDLARGLAKQGAAVCNAMVSEYMTSDLVTCGPNDSTESLMELMTQRRIRHLPVIDEGELVGMISIGDVVKSRLEELESHAESLKEYIAGSV